MPRAVCCGMARSSAGTFGSNRIFFTRFSFALVAADLIHREAEMGNHVFKGDASLGVLLEVLARGDNGAPVFLGQGFVVWFDQDFEEWQNCGDLVRAELFQ